MILYLHNMSCPYICAFDVEHDAGKLVQFSGIVFKRIGDGLYQLCRNLNIYHKVTISKFITQFTGLTQDFLNENGVTRSEFINSFQEFLEGIDCEDIMFFAHGAYQDVSVLINNGLPLDGARYMCTHTMAKQILDRADHLTVQDIAEECGYMYAAHDAYQDAWATAVILSYLLKKQGEKDYE